MSSVNAPVAVDRPISAVGRTARDHGGERGRLRRAARAARAAPAGTRPAGWARRRCAGLRSVRSSAEQPAHVDHVDPGPGLRLGQPVGHHRPDDLLADPDAGRPGAQHHHGLLARPRPGGHGPGGQRGHRHRGGALDVVVEREQLVPVALQDGQRVRGGEVLPLQQHIGQLGPHRLDEPVHETGGSRPRRPGGAASPGTSGRPAVPGCRCPRRAAPAGCGPGRCRPARCTATASRSGCPSRRCPGRPGRGCAARRSPRSRPRRGAAGCAGSRRSGPASG